MKKITIKMWSTILVILLSMQFSMAQWEEIYTGTGMFMRDICFVPGTDNLWQTGWAISYEGDIVKTTDGGDTWVEISQTISSSLAGISFADETTGYIATLDYKILKSTDGGTTWTLSTPQLNTNAIDVYFTSASNGYMTINHNDGSDEPANYTYLVNRWWNHYASR